MKVWRRVTALLVSLVLAGCANTGDIAQDNATNSALAGLAVGTLVGAAVTRPAPSPTVVVPTYGYGYAPYGYAPYGYRPPMRPVHPLGLVYPHGRR
jgi:hypothetical protein